ncbi:hypothetical protein HDU87_007749 [Geranomyces variabilis]|uniref:Uncharacterized protein n=1 Tax=Geranomyces variabilis TaxID=109894 RepID=A0AAD5TDR4_9FUNG|nr:hypothetical protein HDU87_007749 [Geranomyces variabilis]
MGYQRSPLEQTAFVAVNSFLDNWDKAHLSKPDAGLDSNDALSGAPQWKHYAQHRGTSEADRKVQFLTVWSLPTAKEPVPSATAGVWVTYEGSANRPATAPTLSYRFEHQHLTHSSANAPSPLFNPSLRLPDILAAKRQVSTAIVNSQLLQSETWEEHAQRQHEETLGSPTASSDLLTTPPSGGGSDGSAGLSAWTRAALVARTGRAQTAIAERAATRNPEEDALRGFSPASLVPKVVPLQVTAELIMGRTYLGPDQVAEIPAIPSDWNVVTGQVDAEVLRYERDERVRRREEARKAEEEAEAEAAAAPTDTMEETPEESPREEDPVTVTDPALQKGAQGANTAPVAETRVPTSTAEPADEQPVLTKQDLEALPAQVVPVEPSLATESVSAEPLEQHAEAEESKGPEAPLPAATGTDDPQDPQASDSAPADDAASPVKESSATDTTSPVDESAESNEQNPEGLSSEDSIGSLVETEEDGGLDGVEPSVKQ